MYADYADEEDAAWAEAAAAGPEPSVHFSVRLPQTMAIELQREASRRKITLSELVRRKLADRRPDSELTPAQEARVRELVNESVAG